MKHDEILYDYSAGVYCGVLMTKPVMEKLAKLQAKHLMDVKEVLTDAANRGHVFPSSWTLHYPKGKQTSVRFIDKSADVYDRIKLALTSNPPRREALVFVASSMDEAKKMADEYQESGEAID